MSIEEHVSCYILLIFAPFGDGVYRPDQRRLRARRGEKKRGNRQGKGGRERHCGKGC